MNSVDVLQSCRVTCDVIVQLAVASDSLPICFQITFFIFSNFDIYRFQVNHITIQLQVETIWASFAMNMAWSAAITPKEFDGYTNAWRAGNSPSRQNQPTENGRVGYLIRFVINGNFLNAFPWVTSTSVSGCLGSDVKNSSCMFKSPRESI